jgi:hypothetical protein
MAALELRPRVVVANAIFVLIHQRHANRKQPQQVQIREKPEVGRIGNPYSFHRLQPMGRAIRLPAEVASVSLHGTRSQVESPALGDRDLGAARFDVAPRSKRRKLPNKELVTGFHQQLAEPFAGAAEDHLALQEQLFDGGFHVVRLA